MILQELIIIQIIQNNICYFLVFGQNHVYLIICSYSQMGLLIYLSDYFLECSENCPYISKFLNSIKIIFTYLMQGYPVFNRDRYQAIGMPLASQRLNRSRSNSRSPSPTPHIVQRSPFEPNVALVNSVARPNNQPIGPPRVYAQRPQTVSRIQQRVRGQLIKGDSRIEYVPVQKKVVDYVDQHRYEVVPKKKTITDYRQFKKVDIVPREVTNTDYYAIEHIRTYVPQVKVEKYVDYVPRQHRNISYQYIPVERQLIHYPKRQHQQQNSRYLGIREQVGPKVYENVNQQDIRLWEKQYGYVRGESMQVLNEKIKRKAQLQIEDYYRQCRKQFDSKSTMAGSQYTPSIPSVSHLHQSQPYPLAPQPLQPATHYSRMPPSHLI